MNSSTGGQANMKVTVERDQLHEALQKLQSVVEKKNTVQILSNILLTSTGDKLSLSATDLEVGMKLSIPTSSLQEGRITIPSKHFSDIVKELPSRSLQISRKDNDWVEIVSGKSRFNIVGTSAEEFPALPQFEEKAYFEVKSKTLAEMVDRTAFAVSTDVTRYHLNGVYFEKLESQLMRMVATDGHRLSYVDGEVFLEIPDLKKGVIIPRKGLHELRKLLHTEEEHRVSMAFDRGYLFVRGEYGFLFIRLIEGEYPDYKPVIPKQSDKLAILDKELFTSALRRVSLLAHEKSKGVKFVFEKNLLKISSSNPDMGEAREEIEIIYDADNVEIGFNAKYLLDCLPVMLGKDLEFRFKDRLSPGVFQSKDNKSHTYIVMPMRI